MANKNGFTLIELLAVIVVLGLLAGLAIPAISKNINETREQTYMLHEADMESATANMMSECLSKGTQNCVPRSGETRTYSLADLISLNYSDVLKDPANTSEECDENASYVVVKNTGSNIANLEYQVCLVCSEYVSGKCEGGIPELKCNPESDIEAPVCGEIVGQSTLWTNEDRIISVGCSDNDCGCSQDTYYQKFSESMKEGKIKIKDNSTDGNVKICKVNVYVDKEAPQCELEIVGSKANGWYNGSEVKVRIKNMSDQIDLSGIATYGIGTSRKNPNYNKANSFSVLPGITTVYGYVKDNAGNEGRCAIEVKYDSEVPTGNVTYGYQVYPKEDMSLKKESSISLQSKTMEYGNIIGIKVYLNNNSSGMSTTITNGDMTLASRTISAGVTEMLYTFEEGTYDNININMGSTTNVNRVKEIELITDHTLTDSDKFYTNEDVNVYITSLDSYSGSSSYSFDGGITWQLSNTYPYATNNEYKMFIKDVAGNKSVAFNSNINNIDKLEPLDAIYSANGGEYTINVGATNLTVSTLLTIDDAQATSSYAKSGVVMIMHAWTTTLTEPSSWTSSSNSLSKTLTGGSNYLWVKIKDNAGNEKITRSNDFNVGYQVRFNCNDGDGCPAEQRKVHNQSLVLSNTIPTRSGYEFIGWGLSASTHSVAYSARGSYTDNKPIELYAIWKKTLTFTFNENGASLDATTKSCDLYNAETTCSIKLPKITRTGGTVYGFNTNASAKSATSGWTSEANVSVSDSDAKTWYAITKKNAVTYTINYQSNGGSGTTNSTNCTTAEAYNTETVTSCTADIAKNNFTKTGHTFNGWKTSDDTSYTAGGTASISSNLTLNAQWRANTLKVYYNANGGTINSEKYSLNGNDIYESSERFNQSWTYNSSRSNGLYNAGTFGLTRTGYTFVGWNTKSDGSGTTYDQDDGAIVPTNLNSGIKNGDVDLTLYAIWKKTLTFTFNANGASLDATTKSCDLYNAETTCSIKLPKITRTGGTVYGFNTNASAKSATSGWTSEANVSVSDSNDKTWYAITKKNAVTYTINYQSNGGSGTTNSTNCTIAEAYNTVTQATSCTADIAKNNFTKTGHTFNGWKTSDDTSYTAGGTASISSNLTLNAQWRANTLKVYYNANGGTINSEKYSLNGNNIYESSERFNQSWTYNSSRSNGLYNAGTFGLTRTGYTFVGWNTKSDGSGTTYDQDDGAIVPTNLNSGIKNGDVDLTLYAIWKQSVTITSICETYGGGGGSDTPLFGSTRGDKTGTNADGTTLQNYGSLETGLNLYWCTSGCDVTKGYPRICVADECGPYKGKSAGAMNDAAEAAGISENDCHFSNYWCKCG